MLLRVSALLFAPMLVVGIAAAQVPSAEPAPGALPLDRLDQNRLLPVPPDEDAEKVPRILNDTPEYCAELRADIASISARRGGMSPDAAMLTREGEHMCEIGHIRPGIFRLRSALMILRRGG